MNNYQLVCELFNKIKQDDVYYKISFFPIRTFARDLSKKYKTTKILKVIESTGIKIFGKSSIKIHRFFIPEFIYMLRTLPPRYAYKTTIELLENETWYKSAGLKYPSRVKLNRLDVLKYTLQQHQLNFVKSYDQLVQQYRLNGYILGFEQGLGKTLTSIALMEALNKDCVIIIAPKSTILNVWQSEINKYYKDNQKIWVVNHNTDLDIDTKFFIFNYESMNKFSNVYQYISKKKSVGIIVDESHNFLQPKSIRTKNLVYIKQKTNTDDLLLLSGTPIKALGSEMIPMLTLLDPMFDEDAQVIFSKAFGLNTVFATQILKNRMGMIMHRKLKADVLNLPEKHELIRKIKIPNGNDYTIENIKKEIVEFISDRRKFHDANMPKYNKDFNEVIDYLSKELGNDRDFKKYLSIINDLKKTGYNFQDRKKVELVKWANTYEKEVLYPMLPNDLKRKFLSSKSAIKYIELKIKGEVIGTFLTRKRATMTSDMIKHSDLLSIIKSAEKKTVIFTSFVESAETTYEYCKSKQLNPVLVYGKTSGNIKSILHQFKTKLNLNPLIATIQTMSTGVTLVEANTVIFLNRPWRYINYSQAADRVHRIGQDSEVFIFTFVLDTGNKPNLSEHMEDIITWSKEMFDHIIGSRLVF